MSREVEVRNREALKFDNDRLICRITRPVGAPFGASEQGPSIFPGLPSKYRSARLIEPTETFGIPTWFVRVAYRSDAFDFALHPITANVFISRQNYRVIRLAAHARARNRDGSVYKLTLYQRFSRYGAPLRIRLPKKCRTFPRLHIDATPAPRIRS